MSARAVAVILDSESDAVKVVKGNTVTVQNDGKAEKFSFDSVFYAKDVDQLNRSHTNHVPDDLLSGVNTNVVCFGPAGRDTYQALNGGFIQSLFKDLYSRLDAMKNMDHLISASFMRIGTNGEMEDLLNPHTRKMNVKNSQQIGVIVENLSAIICSNEEEAICLYSEGLKMHTATKNPGGSAIFTMFLSQRQKGDPTPRGILSKLTIFDLASADAEKIGVKSVFKAAEKGKLSKEAAASPVMKILQDALITGMTPALVACISSEESDTQKAVQTLELVKSIAGFKSSPRKNNGDLENLLHRLRQDVKSIRDRIMQQSQPSKKDLASLDELLAEISAAKRTGWEQRIALSNQHVEERKKNLAERGMLWVLDSGSTGHAEIKKLQTQVDKLQAEYKEQRQHSDRLKEELKTAIEQYSKLVESGKSDENDAKALVVKIQQMKESYKTESDKTNEARTKVKRAKEHLRKEKEAGLDIGSFNFEMTFRKLEEDRKRMKQENQQIVTEELETMKLEVDHEKAQLEMRSSAGQLPQVSEKEAAQNAVELAALKAEKSVMTTQLDVLKKEKNQLEEHIRILGDKHAKEAEIQQLQNLQTFRAYREVFEEFKVELENRWRGLLDDAIQDAVFLNSRNSELSQENQRLKLEANELKDKLSIAGIPVGKRAAVAGIKEA